MEKRDDFVRFRVNTGDIWAFVAVTVAAGVSKILEDRVATVLLGDICSISKGRTLADSGS
jgi:hypothetical protein